MSRRYQPIWDAIKARGSVRVGCTEDAMPRIKKAVIKEKNIDSDPKWRARRLVITRGQSDRGEPFLQFKLELVFSVILNGMTRGGK